MPALLVMTWGGSTYAWDSNEIIFLTALSSIFLVAFILIEKKAEDPVLPPHLFREPIFTLGSLGLLIIAMGLFGVIAYIPLFLQAVIGMSATNSGITLIPLMVGLMLTLMISGILVRRTGYKIWLLIGPPLTAFGLIMLSSLHSDSSQEEAILYLMIAGAGMGAVFSNYILAAQNVANKDEIGVVTSSMSLFRSIGGTIGVTVFGAILSGRMVLELDENLPLGSSALSAWWGCDEPWRLIDHSVSIVITTRAIARGHQVILVQQHHIYLHDRSDNLHHRFDAQRVHWGCPVEYDR